MSRRFKTVDSAVSLDQTMRLDDVCWPLGASVVPYPQGVVGVVYSTRCT
jgi:hypothetical protein